MEDHAARHQIQNANEAMIPNPEYERARYEADPLTGFPMPRYNDPYFENKLQPIAEEMLNMLKELDAWFAFRPDLTNPEARQKLKTLIQSASERLTCAHAKQPKN